MVLQRTYIAVTTVSRSISACTPPRRRVCRRTDALSRRCSYLVESYWACTP